MKSFSTASVLLLLLFLLPIGAQAQVTGISYTAAPVGLRTFYDRNAGLSDSYTYGGMLGFGFGEYLEVGGEYLRSYDTETDFSDFKADAPVQALLEQLPDRDVNVERYGGRLRLNIGRTGLLPFVSFGTGVIRFDPEGTKATESIYLDAGAGITFSFEDRYTFTVEATRMGYRYSPYATFGLGSNPVDENGNPLQFGEADFPIRTVYNTNVRAALRLYLGGRGRGEMSDVDRAIADQLTGRPRVYLQPFYGRIDFNGKLGSFPDQQPVSGVNAGIDLGPFVGLRGFYWRATDEDALFEGSPIEFRDMQFYGGELNLRFASSGLGTGLTPYVILGGGYMNVDKDYEAEDVFVAPDSRFFASGGVGVDLPLTSNFRLNLNARSLLMSDQDIDDVATPSSIYGSWMYGAGIEFSLGGGGSARDVAAQEREHRQRQMSEAEMEIERLRRQRASLRSELDSTATAYRGASAEEQAEIERLREEIDMLRTQTGRVDTVYVRQNDGTVRAMPAQPDAQTQRRMAQTPTNNLSGQTLAVPVPNVGEIYVRFGDTVGQTAVETYAAPIVVTEGGNMTPQQGQATVRTGGAMTPEQVQQLVRQTLQAELQGANGQMLTQEQIQQAVRDAVTQQLNTLAETNAAAADLAAMQRLEVRLAEMEARLERRMLALERQPETQPQVTVVDGGTTRVVSSRPGMMGRQFYTAFPYIGFRAGEGDNQFLIGGRAEYAPATGNGYRFAPEAAFGFGDGTSFQFFGNILFPFAGNRYVEGLYPYAGAGLGLFSRKGLKGLDLGLNLLVGANYQFGPGAMVFEYSAPGLFDYHRFLVGYRFKW